MVREIPLVSAKYPGLVALVDDDDFPKVSQYKWRPNRSRRRRGPDVFYACRLIPASEKAIGTTVHQFMHRFLLVADGDIDHKDGNGLNNQRSNLRPATHAQNIANRANQTHGFSSRFRGVSWHRRAGRWESHITVNYRKIYLGLFDTEEEAATAYDEAARTHFGEFASANLPESELCA